jgi:hypothetical protein
LFAWPFSKVKAFRGALLAASQYIAPRLHAFAHFDGRRQPKRVNEIAGPGYLRGTEEPIVLEVEELRDFGGLGGRFFRAQLRPILEAIIDAASAFCGVIIQARKRYVHSPLSLRSVLTFFIQVRNDSPGLSY